ncbi:MAG: hypothetical protein ABII06_20520 [Pseudomonadota bacterium]
MLLPTWFWMLATIVALVISVIALLNGLSTRGRMRVFTTKTENLERDMEQYRNSLDQAREQLRKLESERRVSKEIEDLQQEISALRQNVIDLKDRKRELEAEMESSAGLLDKNRDELKKLEHERQRQEPLRRELARLEEQADQEGKKRDGYIKEVAELQGLVSSLHEEHARLKSEIEEMQLKRDIEKEVSRAEEVSDSVVKRPVIRKHSLMT